METRQAKENVCFEVEVHKNIDKIQKSTSCSFHHDSLPIMMKILQLAATHLS